MFVRFPEIVPGYEHNQTLVFEKIPYALFSIQKNEGKKTAFLTENTLIFILKGEKLLHLPDKTICLGENNIILLKQGIYVLSEYIPEGESFEALLIFIPNHFFRQFYYNINTKALSPAKLPYVIMPSSDLLNSFKLHYKNYFSHTLNNLQYILDIKLQELFLLLTSASNKSELLSLIQSIAINTPVDMDFIVRKYLFQPITIPELAKLSGRSIASFKRDFEKRYNTSPRQWINQQRLRQAKLLLENTAKTVAEITYECGYESVSHFIRIFKNEYGTTPASTRKEKIIT